MASNTGESDSGADLGGILASTWDQQQPTQHDVESVADPPSMISIPGPDDMSCASSVTTRHFYDAELFGPSRYPSLQNLHDTDDVEDPTFQPITQQTKSTTTLSALPPLQEESSQDPTDGQSTTTSKKLDETRILKEQEKTTQEHASAHIPSVETLESRINQKTQIYAIRNKDFETPRGEADTGTCVDPAIQQEHGKDEVLARKIADQGELHVPAEGQPLQYKEKILSAASEDATPSSTGMSVTRRPICALNGVPGAFAVDREASETTPQPHRTGNGRDTSPIPSNRENTLAVENLRQEPTRNTVDDDDQENTGTQLPTETLANARPVADHDLPVATEDTGTKFNPQQSNLPFYLMGGLCVLLVVAAIIVGAVCGSGHCTHKVYVDGSSTMAPTTTRDVVEAPKIEITLTLVLGKKYFQQVEESGDIDLSQFLLQCRQKAFDWIVNQDQMQLEYDAPNLLQRFLLVLFYFQTTRYQPWKECNPPSTSQGSAISGLCYEPHPLTGEATSDIWGDQWLSRSHECQWGGVSCLATQSGKRTVVELGLGWNWLNGPLPWEVTRLQLGRLHLKYNLLTGLLPPELLSTESSLPLEYLGLSVNQFTGAIPARWFDNLDEGPAKLTALQLYSNQLIGTLPSEVGLLPLRQLFVARNELTGSLPTEVFSIASLEILLVDSNELTGTLPSEIGVLSNLQKLNLSHTDISGSLPTEIGLATQLGEMYLSFTSMQGTLPEEFYTGLSELNTFWGNNCNFSGTISSLLGLLTSLEWLDLSNNNFDGTIPNEIEALPKLRRFLVNGNALTGTVPVSVCYSAAFVENYGGTSEFVADCLPNAETGVPTIECAADCCTSCCDETGVCLAN